MIKKLLNKIESIYKYRYFSKNEKGAYQFLVQKIHKSTDIDFIENVWQLDHFREVNVPQPLPIENKKILVLAPHQDDEIIGCGGTLCKLVMAEAQITLCFLTDGEELSNQGNSISIRHTEAKKVAGQLNATLEEIGINNVSMDITEKHMSKMIHLLNQNWDEIYTVWPVDQPPKHRLCSYFVGKALKQSNYNKTITFYAVHTDLLPNFYSDISEVIDKKQELLQLYDSQMSVQRYDHLSRGLDAWRSRFLPVSSKERYIETFLRIPAAEYQAFQEIYENNDTSKLFKSHEACIRSFNKIKT